MVPKKALVTSIASKETSTVKTKETSTVTGTKDSLTGKATPDTSKGSSDTKGNQIDTINELAVGYKSPFGDDSDELSGQRNSTDKNLEGENTEGITAEIVDRVFSSSTNSTATLETSKDESSDAQVDPIGNIHGDVSIPVSSNIESNTNESQVDAATEVNQIDNSDGDVIASNNESNNIEYQVDNDAGFDSKYIEEETSIDVASDSNTQNTEEDNKNGIDSDLSDAYIPDTSKGESSDTKGDHIDSSNTTAVGSKIPSNDDLHKVSDKSNITGNNPNSDNMEGNLWASNGTMSGNENDITKYAVSGNKSNEESGNLTNSTDPRESISTTMATSDGINNGESLVPSLIISADKEAVLDDVDESNPSNDEEKSIGKYMHT